MISFSETIKNLSKIQNNSRTRENDHHENIKEKCHLHSYRDLQKKKKHVEFEKRMKLFICFGFVLSLKKNSWFGPKVQWHFTNFYHFQDKFLDLQHLTNTS